jgi:hypothetical protein
MRCDEKLTRIGRGIANILLTLGLLAVLASNVTRAWAQVPRLPATPGQVPCSPAMPAPGSADTPPPKTGDTPPPASGAPQNGAPPNDNLSDRLARSEGVICPPANLDPEMKAPTPDAGNTPVIPPPGNPGGDPTIRPK